MRWYHCLSWFVGSMFLANVVPHYVNGVAGSPFQSPFATPPGVGLSSAPVNVIWALINLVVGYLLVCKVGSFELRRTSHAAIFGLGFGMASYLLAGAFGKLHGGL